jgi:hypothetical protein
METPHVLGPPGPPPLRVSGRVVKRPRRVDDDDDGENDDHTRHGHRGARAAAAAAATATAMAATDSAGERVAATVLVEDVHGPWTPEDDLLLIQAVQQTGDAAVVAHEVRFSRPRSAAAVRARWAALLYSPDVSAYVRRAL